MSCTKRSSLRLLLSSAAFVVVGLLAFGPAASAEAPSDGSTSAGVGGSSEVLSFYFDRNRTASSTDRESSGKGESVGRSDLGDSELENLRLIVRLLRAEVERVWAERQRNSNDPLVREIKKTRQERSKAGKPQISPESDLAQETAYEGGLSQKEKLKREKARLNRERTSLLRSIWDGGGFIPMLPGVFDPRDPTDPLWGDENSFVGPDEEVRQLKPKKPQSTDGQAPGQSEDGSDREKEERSDSAGLGPARAAGNLFSFIVPDPFEKLAPLRNPHSLLNVKTGFVKQPKPPSLPSPSYAKSQTIHATGFVDADGKVVVLSGGDILLNKLKRSTVRSLQKRTEETERLIGSKTPGSKGFSRPAQKVTGPGSVSLGNTEAKDVLDKGSLSGAGSAAAPDAALDKVQTGDLGPSSPAPIGDVKGSDSAPGKEGGVAPVGKDADGVDVGSGSQGVGKADAGKDVSTVGAKEGDGQSDGDSGLKYTVSDGGYKENQDGEGAFTDDKRDADCVNCGNNGGYDNPYEDNGGGGGDQGRVALGSDGLANAVSDLLSLISTGRGIGVLDLVATWEDNGGESAPEIPRGGLLDLLEGLVTGALDSQSRSSASSDVLGLADLVANWDGNGVDGGPSDGGGPGGPLGLAANTDSSDKGFGGDKSSPSNGGKSSGQRTTATRTTAAGSRTVQTNRSTVTQIQQRRVAVQTPTAAVPQSHNLVAPQAPAAKVKAGSVTQTQSPVTRLQGPSSTTDQVQSPSSQLSYSE